MSKCCYGDVNCVFSFFKEGICMRTERDYCEEYNKYKFAVETFNYKGVIKIVSKVLSDILLRNRCDAMGMTDKETAGSMGFDDIDEWKKHMLNCEVILNAFERNDWK